MTTRGARAVAVVGTLLARWDAWCVEGPLRFVDVNLRGIGQVMFQDNPLSGLLFFVAIGWGSYAAGVPQVGDRRASSPCWLATLMAQWLRVETAHAGMPASTASRRTWSGSRSPTFMRASPTLWVYVVLGGAVSVVVTLGITNVFKTWGVARSPLPFVLITWLLLLATNAFSGLAGSALPPSGVIMPIDPVAANPAQRRRLREGHLHEHLAGVPQGHAPWPRCCCSRG